MDLNCSTSHIISNKYGQIKGIPFKWLQISQAISLQLCCTTTRKSTRHSNHTYDQGLYRLLINCVMLVALSVFISLCLCSSSLCTYPSVGYSIFQRILHRSFVKNFFYKTWKLLQFNRYAWHLDMIIMLKNLRKNV